MAFRVPPSQIRFELVPHVSFPLDEVQCILTLSLWFLFQCHPMPRCRPYIEFSQSLTARRAEWRDNSLVFWQVMLCRTKVKDKPSIPRIQSPAQCDCSQDRTWGWAKTHIVYMKCDIYIYILFVIS